MTITRERQLHHPGQQAGGAVIPVRVNDTMICPAYVAGNLAR